MITISSTVLSAEVALLGAEVSRWTTADGLDLQWDGDPSVWRGRAPILFPAIGLLHNNQYHLDGKTYPMPKHGFARHSVFELVDATSSRATLRLVASDATRALYPFEFELTISFEIVGASLAVTAQIANLGDTAMPASFGFHPAFRWPLPFGRARVDHRILFDRDEPALVRRIDADGFLIAEAKPTPVDGNILVLRDDLFVDDALIFDRLRSRKVDYGAPSGPQISVEFADFPTLGVWTKPGAGFVCIEPWHGFSDPVGFAGDFRDKPGSFEVLSGATKTLMMRLTYVEAET